jgi:hypothetical protein
MALAFLRTLNDRSSNNVAKWIVRFLQTKSATRILKGRCHDRDLVWLEGGFSNKRCIGTAIPPCLLRECSIQQCRRSGRVG